MMLRYRYLDYVYRIENKDYSLREFDETQGTLPLGLSGSSIVPTDRWVSRSYLVGAMVFFLVMLSFAVFMD